MKCAYNIYVAKPQEKRQLGRPKHNREDSIKMALRRTWTGFSCLRIVQSGGLLRTGGEPLESIKQGISLIIKLF
jgi:hypothetical protein